MPLLAAAALFACEGGGGGPIVDSNTNWMTECSANSDCDETACLCGVCTLPCQSSATCVELAETAACIAPRDASFDSLCHPSSQPICVPACVGDVDCPDGAACHDGVCTPVWTETDTEPVADADATGDSDRSDSGHLFTCNGERVLSFGRCENGCGALTGPGPSEGCL